MIIIITINLHGGLHKGWLYWSPSQPLLHSQDEELGLRNYHVRAFRPQGDDDDDAQLRCEGFREMMVMILVLMMMKRGIKTMLMRMIPAAAMACGRAAALHLPY